MGVGQLSLPRFSVFSVPLFQFHINCVCFVKFQNRAPVKEHTHDLSVVSGRVDLQQPQVGGDGKEQKVAVYRVKATLDGVERTVDRRYGRLPFC